MRSVVLLYPECTIALMGDFNVNSLDMSRGRLPLYYLTLLNTLGFHPLILRPTRVNQYSATLLDQIWTNNTTTIIESGIVLSDITDHFPIFADFIFSTDLRVAQNHIQIRRRLCTKEAQVKLKTELRLVDWSLLEGIYDVNTLYDGFIDIVTRLYNRYCPVTIHKIKKIDLEKPYITNEIKNEIIEKRRLQKLCYTRPITYRDLFKMQRNKVNQLVKCAREAYYKTKLQQCGSSTKDSWRTLNSLLGQARGNKVCDEFLIGESITTDKHVIVEEFNQYFTSVGSRLAEAYQGYLLGVASKQLRLLHGRVRDSTIVVNSLSPQMRELVEDAIAS